MLMTSCANSKKGEKDKDTASSGHTDAEKMTFSINGDNITVPCKLGDIKALGYDEKEDGLHGNYTVKLKLGDEDVGTAVCKAADENDTNMEDDEVTAIYVHIRFIEKINENGKDTTFSYLGHSYGMSKDDIIKELGEPLDFKPYPDEDDAFFEDIYFKAGDHMVGATYAEDKESPFYEKVSYLCFYSKNSTMMQRLADSENAQDNKTDKE